MNPLRLAELRAANVARQAEWCPEQLPDLSFRGNELAAETGEACNVIKKLERERLGWVGSRDTVEHLGEELADVVITADLVANQADIDLGAAVIRKFNATSENNGLGTRIRPAQVRPEFIEQMEAELKANAGKGDFAAWQPSAHHVLSELRHHLQKMDAAFQQNDWRSVAEFSADCANILMKIHECFGQRGDGE